MIQKKEIAPQQFSREDLKKIREYFLTNVKRKVEGQNGNSSISTEIIEKFLEKLANRQILIWEMNSKKPSLLKC